ncbi:hypothetical protein [Formosa algae]|uniref:Uncharacterized protein n=1 Tax=Formosa algae TaxID=225843 RepID=A0A9X0YHH0_9FLAO|nr:hypothetical protein [Formosa algae]MBP1838642.1 hypothetical protein [Formosa algae]MDQ0335142.1 hypothetical protein [Formosa algae]OEI80393.1 hypothetical protein AST99_09305 [Formosa algae]
MENTIDTSFFFIHRQIQDLKNIKLPKKFSYIIAPLLPVSSLIVGLNYAFDSYWVFVLIIPLILTFILGRASYYFLNSQNIFLISNILELLRLPTIAHRTNSEDVSHFFRGKIFEIKLKEEIIEVNIEEKEVDKISFSEAQSNMITKAFNALSKKIISDDNTLNDFIQAIKYSDLKEFEHINLELESKHCAVFLRSFFIPYVQLLTNKELTLNQASKLFKYRKKNSYRPINADSISKKPRQLSTQYQRITYEILLDELKKVS